MITNLLFLVQKIRRHRGLSWLLILALLLVSIFGNAICYYKFDGKTNPDLSFVDAIWYSIISMTTIGYGDHYATSLGARLGTLGFIVILGLSTFTVFLGTIIDRTTQMILKGQRGMATIYSKNHVLLVNFPSEARVAQVINELNCDKSQKNRDIVVICDLDKLPFSYPNVHFIRGSTIDHDTFSRARAVDASMAMVLATSYSDDNSDAVVASTVSVIDSINPNIHIVAECLNERHRSLFDTVRCNAIVPSFRIAANLLVQEVHDPGITRMIDTVTSNLTESTLYSTKVSESSSNPDYTAIAKILLDHGVNLVSVNRGKESFAVFNSLKLEVGDQLIYISTRRHDWADLKTLI